MSRTAQKKTLSFYNTILLILPVSGLKPGFSFCKGRKFTLMGREKKKAFPYNGVVEGIVALFHVLESKPDVNQELWR